MSFDSRQGTLIVVVGPSGSGKTTLCDKAMNLDSRIKRCRTTTTRTPRPEETGYEFTDEPAFKDAEARGEFVETAWIHNKGWYGTKKSALLELLARGETVVICLDMQGLESMKKAAEEDLLSGARLVSVFISVPEPWRQTLIARLNGRTGGIDVDELAERMTTAESEMQMMHLCDRVVVNDDLKRATIDLLGFIQHSMSAIC